MRKQKEVSVDVAESCTRVMYYIFIRYLGAYDEYSTYIQDGCVTCEELGHAPLLGIVCMWKLREEI